MNAKQAETIRQSDVLTSKYKTTFRDSQHEKLDGRGCFRECLHSDSRNKINSRSDLLLLLEQIAKTGKPLLIIAEDVGGEALAALVVNKLCGLLQVAAVRAPGFGDQRKNMLEDIALLTGTKTIGEGLDVQLNNIQISDRGQARKIFIDKNNTIVEARSRDDQLSFQA